MARKMDPDRDREIDEDLVMRDDDHGIRREERNARRSLDDRDRGVAQRMQREQMRGRTDFTDTDFRARGAPGDWDNTGRFDGEEAFFSGSVREQGGGLDGQDAFAAEDIDLEMLPDDRDAFFQDEDDAATDGALGSRSRGAMSRDARRREHRRDPRDRR